MNNQQGNLSLIVVVILLLISISVAYYLGTRNSQDVSIPTVSLNTDNKIKEKTESIQVKLINGDIVVVKDGEELKITDWGFNNEPVVSPNGNKIAYISKTKESFENEKKYQGYVPTSTNVWIINTDGSNALQVTTHDNWVFRGNLLWLDNNRLLFTDGVSSAKVFNLNDKTIRTVLGSEQPEGSCVDACGGGTEFIFSPDKKYLIMLAEDGEGGIAVIPLSSILNLETLKTVQVNQVFTGIDDNSVQFKDNKMQFQATIDSSEDLRRITVDLSTGQVSM